MRLALVVLLGLTAMGGQANPQSPPPASDLKRGDAVEVELDTHVVIEGKLDRVRRGMATFVADADGSFMAVPAEQVYPLGKRPRPPLSASAMLAGIYLQEVTDEDKDAPDSIPFLFLPNGFVCQGDAIKGGIEQFDPARAEAEHPSRCGRFQVNGARVEIDWKDGEKESYELGEDDGGVLVDGFDRTAILPEGFVLEGRYWMSPPCEDGQPCLDYSITFAKDGSCVFRQAIGLAKDGEDSEDASTRTGRYEVRGNTLITTCEGKEDVETIFLYPDEAITASPTRLNIDGIRWRLLP